MATVSRGKAPAKTASTDILKLQYSQVLTTLFIGNYWKGMGEHPSERKNTVQRPEQPPQCHHSFMASLSAGTSTSKTCRSRYNTATARFWAYLSSTAPHGICHAARHSLQQRWESLSAVLGGSQAVEQKVLRHTHQPPAAGPTSSLLHCILSSSQPPSSLPSTLPPCPSQPMAPPKPSIGCQALLSSLVSSPSALKPHCWELRYDRHVPL